MTNSPSGIESYLSFRLNDELFAVNVAHVLEIMGIPPITKVPKAPKSLTGVTNLRGTVLPVIDTRIKFGLQKTEFNIDTCIIVFKIQMDNDQITIGALVDSVQEVLEISEEELLPPPSIGSKYKSELIKGMYKNNENFIMLLNIDHVFSSDELLIIKDTVSEPAN
ncbi:MAG: chemotaxis protein CheW [Bacteroidota bacterium]|nr:chemotaxis protein CheW [Bacteroidota bacterium]